MYYNEDETKKIIDAYRVIFGTEGNFLDFYFPKINRSYNLIQTDYRKVSFPELEKAREHFEKKGEDLSLVDRKERNEILRSIAYLNSIESFRTKNPSVGMSVGLNPYCDDLLLRSYAKNKKNIVVLLFHNFYPILNRYKSNIWHQLKPPLYKYSIVNTELENKYFDDTKTIISQNVWHSPFNNRVEIPMAIKKLFEKNIVVFLNLYPDFLPLFAGSIGKISKHGTGFDDPYGESTDALISWLEEAKKSFKIGILSFGRPVADAISKEMDEKFPIRTDLSIDYFYHPSSIEFRNKSNKPNEGSVPLEGIAKFKKRLDELA
jgi:hypothetical protein